MTGSWSLTSTDKRVHMNAVPPCCDGRSNPEVVGSIPTEVKRFFFASCGSLFPFTRANAQWVIHWFK